MAAPQAAFTAATPTATVAAAASAAVRSTLAAYATHVATREARKDTYDESTIQTIDINFSYLMDWGNVPGTGPYFTSNNIDAVTQITSAALMGGCCILVFSVLRYRWPELYSHRLRLRYMRPASIPRTLFGWVYPMVTMSDRHVLETVGLDALLYFRAYRMFIYIFIWMAFFGMAILYPVDFFWGKEEGDRAPHTVFDSPLAHVKNYDGKYSAAHAVMAYVFAVILFFYIDRFALHTVTMRWHYLLLTRRSGNSRTLMITHLPRELRSQSALKGFINGMQVGEVESVHVAPMTRDLDNALSHRSFVLNKLEQAYAYILGNPCRAHSYDPVLLKRVILSNDPRAREVEAKLLRRWARRHKGDHKTRLRNPVRRPTMLVRRTAAERPEWPRWRRVLWPYERTDSISHWREEMASADERLKEVRDNFHALEASTVAFVTMKRPVDAYIISQLNVYGTPSTCKISMAPEARSIVWRSVGAPYSKKILRYVLGLLFTAALLCIWCVPVVLISTLVSLRFLVTRFQGLVDVVKNNKFVRSLLNYTLPSLILTIFMTILPRLLWSFVLVGGDRTYGIADKNMLIRHFYFLVIYIVVIFGMSGSVWSSIYDVFTNFGSFWEHLVLQLPQMGTWYCVYVMLYGAGYQVMKLLHLKSVCRYLWHQANSRTPRDYMKAISPVFIDWGTIQPYPLLFFFIGILYAHLQPLLLAMCILYFCIGLFVMKYMCIYAWHFRQQNAGLLWPVIIRRLVACILLYQALMTAIFASNENHWFAAPMVVLMLFTWYYFWVRCRYIKQLSATIPLQLLREAERRRKIVQAREKRELEENEKRAERELTRSAASSSGSGVAWADLQRSPALSASASDDSSAVYPPLVSVLTSDSNLPRPIEIPEEKDVANASAVTSPTGVLADSEGEEGDQQKPIPYPSGASRGGRADDDAERLDGEALITKHTHAPRTRSWYASILHNAVVHPITALVSSVSYFMWLLHGDPSAPLWDFIDDYAFPERVDRLAHPAGRSPLDPRVPKEQPGSLVDIVKAACKGIPAGWRAVKGEFFMQFSIPKAHLDSSIVSYPEATNTEDAFEVRHRRRHHVSSRRRELSGYDARDHLTRIGSRASGSETETYTSDHLSHCLAPQQDLPDDYVARIHGAPANEETQHLLPSGAGVRIHKASTFMPNVNPRTGKPVAMQYQVHSDEIPHGTKMNRRYTDFSQPNMSRLPGVLDSTRFSYLHPGLYGDLPSLWLPVAHLKRRKEMKRSAKERLRDVRNYWEDAVESNILGEKAVAKLQEKKARAAERHKMHKLHPRVKALSDHKQHWGDSDSQLSSANSSAGESDAEPTTGHRRTLSREEAQQKADDMEVANKCSVFGIDPSVLSQWDPTGLHCCNLLHQPTRESAVLSEYSTDATSLFDGAHEDEEGLSGSESDNTEEADDVDAGAPGHRGWVNDEARGIEEG